MSSTQECLELVHASMTSPALARFFDRVNTFDPAELAIIGCRDLGLSATELLRQDYDFADIKSFVSRCPVHIDWVDFRRVPIEAFGTVIPPMYNAIARVISLPSPLFAKNNATIKHALLHETAHHLHFHEHGWLRDSRMYRYASQPAYNIAEMVAESAAAIAGEALHIMNDGMLTTAASYVAMYRCGQGIPTILPAEEVLYILPIAEKLISIYKDTV